MPRNVLGNTVCNLITAAATHAPWTLRAERGLGPTHIGALEMGLGAPRRGMLVPVCAPHLGTAYTDEIVTVSAGLSPIRPERDSARQRKPGGPSSCTRTECHP